MKVQTAFRLEKDLIEQLKVKATAENRSLNNYVETVLTEEIGHEPNEETKQAIYDAHNNINMTKIENLDEYMKNLMDEV